MLLPTCVTWIRRGVCMPLPTKPDQPSLREDVDHKVTAVDTSVGERDEVIDEYGLDDYDEDIAEVIEDALDENVQLDSDEEDEEDAARIDPTDSVLVVGMCGRFPELLVHVYNPDQDYFYVHHDIAFESNPVSLDWIGGSADSACKNNLVVALIDGSLQMWDMDDVNAVAPVKKMQCGSSPLTALHCDDSSMYVGNTRGKVCVWDANTAQLAWKSRIHAGEVRSVAYSRAKQAILSCSEDKKVVVTDLRDPSHPQLLWNLKAEANCTRWNPWKENDLMVSFGDQLGWADCRNSNSFISRRRLAGEDTLELRMNSSIRDMALVGGERGIFYTFDGTDLISKKQMKLGSIIDIAFNPDHKFVCAATGTERSNVKLKDLRTLKSVRERYGINSDVREENP